ncbi:MAG: hypothetical protein L3J83_00650 [Proteobacteria bacterium]|nr:hypothetical protein [Pseudomonadota bacterium]
MLKSPTMKKHKHKHVVDPAFLRESNYSYVEYNDSELDSVLCFALARHPTDLILHQQRIDLFSKKQESTLLFSAIVDLFISLEGKGADYKRRIFEKYKPQLNPVQTSILNDSLNHKLHASLPIQDLTQSILSLGLQGKLLSSCHFDNKINQSNSLNQNTNNSPIVK